MVAHSTLKTLMSIYIYIYIFIYFHCGFIDGVMVGTSSPPIQELNTLGVNIVEIGQKFDKPYGLA
jgi:hypothetical protein